jgi:putative transposase
MPRRAREKSKTGVYHVMVRGINKEIIFHDDEDRRKFLHILAKVKEGYPFELLGHCLMNNHVHLLIQEGAENISQIMKRIGTRYAIYFNSKYDRKGHLFQDRFRSERVEDEEYLLTVLRYIHQNPVKAFLVSDAKDYLWSSYRAYLGVKSYFANIVDKEFILGIFSMEAVTAIKYFKDFMEEESDDSCLNDNDPKKPSDEFIRHELEKLLRDYSVETIHQLKKKERNEILQKLKKIEGITVRQISEITGLGRNIIVRA